MRLKCCHVGIIRRRDRIAGPECRGSLVGQSVGTEHCLIEVGIVRGANTGFFQVRACRIRLIVVPRRNAHHDKAFFSTRPKPVLHISRNAIVRRYDLATFKRIYQHEIKPLEVFRVARRQRCAMREADRGDHGVLGFDGASCIFLRH